jgi:glycosyltransferase involved in cell wall biosynthesis
MSELTVIVPLHNGARFIAATLDSLAAQTLPLAEVIVIDDGSSDEWRSIVEARPLAPRIITQRNAGVAAARNRGALAADTRFIAFLDQDDLWLSGRHERVARFLNANPSCQALVTTESSFYLDEDAAALAAASEGLHRHANHRVQREELPQLIAKLGDSHLRPGAPETVRILDTRELLQGTVTMTCSYVFERELFIAAGGCAGLARTMDDYLALLSISRFADLPLIDEPTVMYRIHPSSTTMSADWPHPLLTGLMAARFGGTLVPSGHGRDAAFVPPLSDFWRHWLMSLARSGHAGLLDALALTRMLGTSRAEQTELSYRAVRAATGSFLRERRPAWISRART